MNSTDSVHEDSAVQDANVEIAFDCLPMRSVGRLDIPLDASPGFQARCQRIKDAIEKHGSHNTYYLLDAHCIFRLTNDAACGMLKFAFEGTVMTDQADLCTRGCDLDVRLAEETCDWLSEPVVNWFIETVSVAVRVEFDRYIAAGDLTRSIERAAKVAAECDRADGFLGMYL